MGSGCATKSGSRFKVQGLVAFIAGSDLTADASQKPVLSPWSHSSPPQTLGLVLWVASWWHRSEAPVETSVSLAVYGDESELHCPLRGRHHGVSSDPAGLGAAEPQCPST